MARTVVHPLAWRTGAQKWLAVAHQGIGWPGWIGVALLAVAAYVAVPSHALEMPSGKASSDQGRSLVAETAVPSPADPTAATGSRVLKTRGDVPLLVTLMERAAVDSGLAWPGAEYRVAPMTDRSLAQLQVRFRLKAPYPKLRQMLVQLTDTIPGLIFQEFSLTRATSQQVEVEAKLRIDVLLDEEDGAQAIAAVAPPGANWQRLP